MNLEKIQQSSYIIVATFSG